MSVSTVKICNTGLAYIGKDPIVTINDRTTAAKLCNTLYEGIRDAVLRAHAWGCAIHRSRLSLSDDYEPPSGYSYAYVLPTDPYCLRVLNMGDDDDDYDYQVEGRYLLTNETEAIIKYIKRVVDPNQFDSLLVQTIAARLAADLAMPLTGSQKIFNSMWGMYELKLQEAQGADNRENQKRPVSQEMGFDEVRS